MVPRRRARRGLPKPTEEGRLGLWPAGIRLGQAEKEECAGEYSRLVQELAGESQRAADRDWRCLALGA